MLKFNQFITEALSDKQKQTLAGYKQKLGKHFPWQGEDESISGRTDFANEAMQGKSRLIVPLSHSGPSEPIIPTALKDHLGYWGFTIHDYVKGYARKSDDFNKNPRLYSIGSVLQRTLKGLHPEDDREDHAELTNMINAYAKDPQRTAKNSERHQIVITRHPEDVAGQSSGRGWGSCMTMDGDLRHTAGIHSNKIYDDLREGTHIAYLTSKGDDTVQNPLGRIALKPYRATSPGNSHTVLRPEPRIYGSGHDAFTQSVRHWTEHNFPMQPKQLYKLDQNVYSDHRTTHDDDVEDDEHRQNVYAFSNDTETLNHFARHPSPHVRAMVVKHGDEEVQKKVLAFERSGKAFEHANNEYYQDELEEHDDTIDPHPTVMHALATYGTPEIHKRLLNTPIPQDTSLITRVVHASADPEIHQHALDRLKSRASSVYMRQDQHDRSNLDLLANALIKRGSDDIHDQLHHFVNNFDTSRSGPEHQQWFNGFRNHVNNKLGRD